MTDIDPSRVIKFMAAESANDRERIAMLLAENEALTKKVQRLDDELTRARNKPVRITPGPQRAIGESS